jgi:hypothetical protein
MCALAILGAWTLGAGLVTAVLLRAIVVGEHARHPPPPLWFSLIMAVLPIGMALMGLLMFVRIAMSPWTEARWLFRRGSKPGVEESRLSSSCPRLDKAISLLFFGTGAVSAGGLGAGLAVAVISEFRAGRMGSQLPVLSAFIMPLLPMAIAFVFGAMFVKELRSKSRPDAK